MELLIGTLVLRPYVFLFLAAFLVLAVRDLGVRRTLAFGGIVWPIAWLAEFSSTRTGVPFGFYHYTGLTRGQELYIADVPFFDSLSFTFLAYAAFCLARHALRGRTVPVLTMPVLAGALMTMLDVVIDPVAVRGDRWFLGDLFRYAEDGAYFGVPLSNFAGWWLVGTTGVGAYVLCCGSGGHTRQRTGPGVALYYAVLGFNLAVTAWIGEWRLLGVGLAFHGVMAAILVAMVRRAQPFGVPETGGVQQV